MNKRYILLISIGIILVTAVLIITAAMSMQNNRSTVMDDPSIDEATGDVEYDYSQYDILKEIVVKLNSHGGSITSVENYQYDFTASYTFQLKDDLLIVAAPGGNQLTIFHIQDIRIILVN